MLSTHASRTRAPGIAVATRVVAILALLMVGCDSGPRLEQVGGSVTYDGAPIKRGHIVLEPRGGRSARGKIVDGEIVGVQTYKRGDGALVGEHRVSVIAFVREPKGMEVPPSLIPEHYQNPMTSGLTAVIEAGAENRLKLELTK